MSTYKPLGNRVLIKQMEEEDAMTRGGLYVPDTAKEKPQKAEVLAVGPGRLDDNGKRQPMEVKVGDVVLFAKYAGTEVKGGENDEEELMVLREDDILAVVEG